MLSSSSIASKWHFWIQCLTLFRDGRVLMSPGSLFRQVVQMVDNTIHWINLSPHIAQSVSPTLIRWRVIYPRDSAILLLNNRSQINHCPVDKHIYDMQMRYPLDRDWSSRKQYPPFENLGPESYIIFKVIIRNRFLTIEWFKHAIRGHIWTPGGGLMAQAFFDP